MKILNSAEMREIDRATIETVGIPGPVLMENAGRAIAGEIIKRFPDIARKRVVVVAGKGNNGGDGFVVARRLHDLGAEPVVLLLAARAELRGDAALNLGIAERTGVAVEECASADAWKGERATLAHAGVIVDAIFGTGLQKPAEGLFAAAIADINKARGFKVAVDVPSGLSSDTFLPIGPAVKADLTVTLAAPKIALMFPPAADFAGEIVCADIGIPPRLLRADALKLEMTEPADIAPFFTRRSRDSHKGSYGHLLILAGSRGKTGAAILAARAAYRSGAGLVTVAAPAGCLPVIARGMAELMTEPLAESAGGSVAAEALDRVMALAKGKDAVLIGPGLSTDPGAAELVRALPARLAVPVVIDADGLNNLAGRLEVLKKLRAPAVLTPHPGEFARLVGRPVKDVLDRRLELAPEFAVRHGVILVLKGYRTLVASPDGRVFVNPTGNPGMATGGAGDVLSGILGALAMTSKDVLGAARAAVYLHGLCGDLAAAKTGERGLIAGDLIRALPAAAKSLEPGGRT